jgi:hypothetical protein
MDLLPRSRELASSTTPSEAEFMPGRKPPFRAVSRRKGSAKLAGAAFEPSVSAIFAAWWRGREFEFGSYSSIL